MATPESKVKRWLDIMLREEGLWFFSPQAGPYGKAGIPDRIAILCGLFLGIEAKATAKSKMTALQEHCKKQIEMAGGVHWLVYDKNTIETLRLYIRTVKAAHGGAGCSGQEGSCGSGRRPQHYTECNPISQTSEREPSISTA